MIVRRMLRHHADCRPIGPGFDVPGSAVPAVGMIGDARNALIPAESVDDCGRLDHGVVAAAVAPAPDVETLIGHVAEGRWTVV